MDSVKKKKTGKYCAKLIVNEKGLVIDFPKVECPVCGADMRLTENGCFCSASTNDNPCLRIYADTRGVILTPDEVITLAEGGSVERKTVADHRETVIRFIVDINEKIVRSNYI